MRHLVGRPGHAIAALLLPLSVVLFAGAALAQARKPAGAIVYRFHSPIDLDHVVETADVKITDIPGESTIVTYRKPRGTLGSRNYVQEDRQEDSTTVNILTEKEDVLYSKDDSTGSWAVRSSASRDSYYVMQEAVAGDSALTHKGDARGLPIRDDATFADYDYPYVLVEVVGGRARLFDCAFDTARMTSVADRRFLRRSSHGDFFVEPALDRIARFLSEHGSDMKADQCTPVTPGDQPGPG
jgi:hypothetical protein